MNFRRNCFRLMQVAAAMLLASCGGDDKDPILTPTPGPSPSVSANPYLARIEVPKLEDGNLFVEHSSLVDGDSVMTYCLEYNPKKLHSRWVAFRFDAKTRNNSSAVKRKDFFSDDTSLPQDCWIGYRSFGKQYVNLQNNIIIIKGSNIDRGHICASDDRKYSQEANDQTFNMSNMSPQFNDFNGIFWLAFEQTVQNWGRNSAFADTLYVVKGGTITDKVGGGKDDGLLGYVKRDYGKQVALPKYYFMALLCQKDGRYKALGFLMEHKDMGYPYAKSSEVTAEIKKQYAVSIDDLEAFTGIDFFHNLPDDVEKSVEAICTPADWGL